jgi:hypothetical protein
MSVETRHPEGRYEIVFRREGGGRGRLSLLAAVVGILLAVAPVVLAPPATTDAIAGMTLLEILLLVATLKFLAEMSRARQIVTSLHIASGELEVRAGRGVFAKTQALGAVEVDHFLLCRSEGPDARFTLSVVARLALPVPIVTEDPDELKVRDVALLLSQGMDVSLEDRRYDVTLRPEGAGPQAPARVAVFDDGSRIVFTWSYRDRLRPGLSLLILGTLAFLAFGLPAVIEPPVAVVFATAGVMTLLAIGLLIHVLRSLVVRRVTVREDAVRVERSLAGVPLLSHLALLPELKAILVLKKGGLARIVLRLSGRRTAVSLPFEDPRVAGWLSGRIHHAAHSAAKSAAKGGS